MSATKRQKKEVEQEGKKKLVAFDSVVMRCVASPPHIVCDETDTSSMQ